MRLGDSFIDFVKDEKERIVTNEQISKLEISLIGPDIVPAEDVLPSVRDLKTMCHLYSSLVGRFIEPLFLIEL